MATAGRTWLQKLFSFEGRTSRIGFWRTFLCLQFASAVVLSLSAFATMAAGWAGAIPALLFLPLLVTNLAVIVRRLHDRGKSGWWTLIFNAAPLTLVGVGEGLPRLLGQSSGGAAGLMVLFLATGLGLWGWVEMGLLKGQAGANRYGAPA
ncbi:MAG: DUF805 domain-containing protein [Proteobacteria bacterium]|nr:DUF805 domain-containing protein [Pseudomonadota bacterium]